MTLWHSLCQWSWDSRVFRITRNIWHNMPKLSVCMQVPSVSNWDEWERWRIPLSRYYWLLLFPLCGCMFHSLSSVWVFHREEWNNQNYFWRELPAVFISDASVKHYHSDLLAKGDMRVEQKPRSGSGEVMKVKTGRSPWAAFHITFHVMSFQTLEVNRIWTVLRKTGSFVENKKLASCV